MPWIRITMLVVAVAFAGIAVVKGQDIEWVGLNGEVHFYDSQGRGSADPAAQQQLQEQRAEAEQAQGTGAPAGVADLSGIWYGDDGSVDYAAYQSGHDVVLAESQDGELTAVCSGTVSGNTYTFSFEAVDGTQGVGSFTLQPDGVLTGHVTTSAQSGTMTLTRQPG